MSDDELRGLSGRARNRLRSIGITTRAQIATVPDADLLAIQNFGRGTLAEIRAFVPYQQPETRESVMTTILRDMLDLDARTEGAIARRTATVTLSDPQPPMSKEEYDALVAQHTAEWYAIRERIRAVLAVDA